jgi:hypothetical protein
MYLPERSARGTGLSTCKPTAAASSCKEQFRDAGVWVGRMTQNSAGDYSSAVLFSIVRSFINRD